MSGNIEIRLLLPMDTVLIYWDPLMNELLRLVAFIDPYENTTLKDHTTTPTSWPNHSNLPRYGPIKGPPKKGQCINNFYITDKLSLTNFTQA